MGSKQDNAVAELYWALIRARLRDVSCKSCGTSLSRAIVVAAGEGTTLDDYGLSDSSTARLLAATEVLTVRCDRCDTTCEVGSSLVHAPEAPIVVARDLAQWSPHALEVYRSIVATRLADRKCTACGSSLSQATVDFAAGGSTLPEFDLDDDGAVAVVAWSQQLAVSCPQCGEVVTI